VNAHPSLCIEPLDPFHLHIAPTCTYFRSSDVEPKIAADGRTITVWQGYGKRRSWGTPSVQSHPYWLIYGQVLCVHVVGWHKHSISPVGGCYYYVLTESGWTRRMASAKVVKDALSTYLDDVVTEACAVANRLAEGVPA
jgi:hypothetical protein